MSDSLVIANSIELLQGDSGGALSTLPLLGGTIFALNDQQQAYDLGAPQPTVDILASLITDGERPQGRRASNRTLVLPIAIISDSRDNLALARETLLQLVDAQETERFTLTYTRDPEDSDETGPLILDCWRAEPTSIQYSQPEENQYVCELVLQFEALPYGRSDTPNTITFFNPASGGVAPPSPITLDPFNVIPSGMQGTWVTTTASVNGPAAAFCPSPSTNPQITNPFYINNNIGTNDLTAGTGGAVPNGDMAELNVIQFWAGFASQAYFNNWANHESEVRFIVTLTDVNGNTVAASRQYRMSESNSYKTPKYHNIQVRIPTQQSAVFDWTQVTGFSIKVQNFGDALFHNSNVFLDTCNAIAPSASAANLTRGSIYKLNGVEGSIHTAASFIIQQQASINPTTQTLTPASFNWQAPAGVSSAVIENVGPGGSGAAILTPTAYGGGGGSAEYSRENNALLTAGNVYPIVVPSSMPQQLLTAFTSWTQVAQFNSPGPNISNPGANFVAATVAASNSLVFVVVAPPGASLSSTWVFDDNSANVGPYKNIGASTAPDGTQTVVFALFDTVALTSANTYSVTGLTSPTSVEIVGFSAQGIWNYLPQQTSARSGTSALPYADIPGFLNTHASANDITNSLVTLANAWVASGTNASLSMNSSPPGAFPTSQTVDLVTTSGAVQAQMTSKQMFPVFGGSTILMPRIFSYMTTQTDLHVWLDINWYDVTKTFISTVSDEVLKTASTWEWLSGTTHTAPSSAAFFTIDARLNSSTANNPLHVAELGAVQQQSFFPQEFTVFANNSDMVASTAPGWTHLYSSAAENPLSNDIFTASPASPGTWGGDLCAGQGYSGSAPWGAVTVTFARTCQTVFPADNVTVVANGGVGLVPGNSNGGSPGLGSLNSIHNQGAFGAAGVATNGGGGASSGGSGGAATFVEDTNGSLVFTGSHMAPPQLISSGIPQPGADHASLAPISYTYGANITQLGASSGDVVLVAVVPDSTSNADVQVTDNHNNPYTWIQTAHMADGRNVQIFYIDAATFTTLKVGDIVYAAFSSDPHDYAIFVYVMANVTGLHGTAQNLGDGNAHGDSTGTTASLVNSGLGTGNRGATVFTLNETNQSASMAPLQNTPADVEDFAGVKRHDGTNWTQQGQHLDLFWADTTATSQTFNFTLPVSADLATIAITWNLSTGNWISQSGQPTTKYNSGTHHYSHFAGQKVVISFSGPQAQVIGVQGPNQGIMLVSVDSGPYFEVDNYATAYRYKAVLFDTGTVTNTTHTITILTAALHNSASTDSYIDIDGYQILSTTGAGLPGSGVTGGAANVGGGAGGNGGATNAAGTAGSTPGGGGGGAASTSGTKAGGAGGAGQILLTYYSTLPTFKTCILHRPSLDGSKTLLPYIACVTQAVPTSDLVQPIDVGTVAQFKGTYTMMVAAATWNSPSASRTVTVTVNEYERQGGSITSTQSTSRVLVPNTDSVNGIVSIGELTLPNKDIPDENSNAVYYIVVNSTNASDTIQDVMMLDTMGQTVFINESIGYSQYFIDEPFPDKDIGRILGSQFDRPYAISVLDAAYPTGGPITLEPGDNILFAYCYEGAPALVASYFPRYYIDRTVS